LNSEIATLQTAFTQNVLKEKNASSVVVHDRAELAGLSDSEIAGLQQAAVEENKPGEYVIRIKNTTGQPLLSSLEDRALRQRIMETSLTRGSHGGPFDNQATVVAIARKRAERAVLLGYEDHAAYQVEIGPRAPSAARRQPPLPARPPSVAKAKREGGRHPGGHRPGARGLPACAVGLGFLRREGPQGALLLRRLPAQAVLRAEQRAAERVFFAANRLYGLTFKERHDLPVYRPEVRTFQIYDADGAPLAILIEDF